MSKLTLNELKYFAAGGGKSRPIITSAMFLHMVLMTSEGSWMDEGLWNAMIEDIKNNDGGMEHFIRTIGQ